MPIILPIVMILVSCYLVIAPILEDPAMEFLYAFLFIVSGLIVYFPLVKFKLQPKWLGKDASYTHYNGYLDFDYTSFIHNMRAL